MYDSLPFLTHTDNVSLPSSIYLPLFTFPSSLFPSLSPLLTSLPLAPLTLHTPLSPPSPSLRLVARFRVPGHRGSLVMSLGVT